MTSGPWNYETRRGSATELHARSLEPGRLIEELIPQRNAVVLGSSQRGLIDPELAQRCDVEIVRRKGGGGAVWLSPGSQLWLEITIGQLDPLWDVDVGRAFEWVGELFVAALGDLGVRATQHRGAMLSNSAAELVCFAGLGPGEITVNNKKLIGISQRRTKVGSRFQCVVYQDLDHGPLVSLLGLGESGSQELHGQLERSTSDCTRLGTSIIDLLGAIRARLEL